MSGGASAGHRAGRRAAEVAAPLLAAEIAAARPDLSVDGPGGIRRCAQLSIMRLWFTAYAEQHGKLDAAPLTALAGRVAAGRPPGRLWAAAARSWQAWAGIPGGLPSLFAAGPGNPAAAAADGLRIGDDPAAAILAAILCEPSDGASPARPVEWAEGLAGLGAAYEHLLDIGGGGPAPAGRPAEGSGGGWAAEQTAEAAARKTGGIYYTSGGVVARLLDSALEPALDRHTDRLDRLAASEGAEAAAERMFDFRCADIAMGAGNFLLPACDRIADRLERWAESRLGRAGGWDARARAAETCMYGCDRDWMAAAAARLSLALHAGCGEPSLAGRLVAGDSLTAAGETGRDGTAIAHLFYLPPAAAPGGAADPGDRPVAFPDQFPEVFDRPDPGFDCLLGNPPWGEIAVERQKWWGRRYAGLRGLPIAEMTAAMDRLAADRADLEAEYRADIARSDAYREKIRAAFPMLGAGRADLYKAFAWRYWELARPGGMIGIVLPRTALITKGSAQWRKTVIAEGSFARCDVLANGAGWAFAGVHHRYTFVLAAIDKTRTAAGTVPLPRFDGHGGHASASSGPVTVRADEFLAWSPNASFPNLPDHPDALRLFRTLRSHPTLNPRRAAGVRRAWRFAPTGEIDPTGDQRLLVLDGGRAGDDPSRPDMWPVYKGASFYLWQPDTGIRYASGDVGVLARRIAETSGAPAAAPASGAAFDMALPAAADPTAGQDCLRPRVAFRVTAGATDNRTIIAALIPPRTFVAGSAAYLRRVAGTVRDEAYLLGLLASMILDWYARRAVERNVNNHFVDNFPVPDPGDAHPARSRLADIAARLAAADGRYAEWAAEAGDGGHGPLPPAELDDLAAEMDACAAVVYGLDEAEIGCVYDTFSRTVDHTGRKLAVLAHWRQHTGAAAEAASAAL